MSMDRYPIKKNVEVVGKWRIYVLRKTTVGGFNAVVLNVVPYRFQRGLKWWTMERPFNVRVENE